MNAPTPAQLGQWFDTYAARLVLYARQWLERSIAEDIVQEAFMKIAAQPCPPDNVVAWLFTTVRNAASSAARSNRRRKKRESEVARPSLFDTDADNLIDAATAQEALTRLPDDQREIITLRIWGGLTWPEAAEVLGEPFSTLFSRYKTGLAKLRQLLETPCPKRTT